VKVDCVECGSRIATFLADTRRKKSTQHKEAVCEDCYGDIDG